MLKQPLSYDLEGCLNDEKVSRVSLNLIQHVLDSLCLNGVFGVVHLAVHGLAHRPQDDEEDDEVIEELGLGEPNNALSELNIIPKEVE